MAGFKYIASATVAPTDTSVSTTLGEGSLIILTNVGSVAVFVSFGAAATTATANGLAIAPNSNLPVIRDGNKSVIAYITASGTGSLNIATGRWSRE